MKVIWAVVVKANEVGEWAEKNLGVWLTQTGREGLRQDYPGCLFSHLDANY